MIDLLNIYKSYDEKKIITDFSLHIDKNEFVCITGESGSGKTTLLNIIGLLDKPDQGSVSINGINSYPQKEILKLRRTFYGYIFQDYLLMKDKTVIKNLKVSEYGKNKLSKDHLNHVLSMVGLDKTYLNKKVCQLSGGEQQKLAIARMMLKPYELVLADEPTGNLDYKNKLEIINLFKQIKAEGKTIICVTHDKIVADAADRIINLTKEK
ncbi:MAG: ABC transporter ATP-binding protein [Eubacterium sp.]|nr:ABC transporter ATP-binding protein [Eubacterium sp.]